MKATYDFALLKPSIQLLLDFANPRSHFVVFDIDDTLLRWGGGPTITPVPAGLWIHNQVVAAGLDVVYVTARRNIHNSRDVALEQLRRVGIPLSTTTRLFMRPVSCPADAESLSHFKATARAGAGTMLGKTCVLSVGDNWFDIMHVSMPTFINLNNQYDDQFVLTFTDENSWGVKLP